MIDFYFYFLYCFCFCSLPLVPWIFSFYVASVLFLVPLLHRHPPYHFCFINRELFYWFRMSLWFYIPFPLFFHSLILWLSSQCLVRFPSCPFSLPPRPMCVWCLKDVRYKAVNNEEESAWL